MPWARTFQSRHPALLTDSIYANVTVTGTSQYFFEIIPLPLQSTKPSNTPMVLLYCKRTSNRISYSAELLLGAILGTDWRITNSWEEFLSFQGAKICYSDQRHNSHALCIETSELLFEKGINAILPEVKELHGLKVLYPSRSSLCDIGFDCFAAAFYLVSRYEEYLPYSTDMYGRFEASQSLAGKHGFLDTPVVNHYALLLKKALQSRFPKLQFPQRQFRYIPTIDVDVAFAYKGRGLARTLYGYAKSLKDHNTLSVRQRTMVLMGKEPDPFDTYDEQIRLHDGYGFKPHYFFLCGKRSRHDRNLSCRSRSVRMLIQKIRAHATIGIHPSMASNLLPHKLPKEIERLESILQMPVTSSRQHFLWLKMPTTYQQLANNRIETDFSMGYASDVGFRAGICTPYPFYDIEKESASSLTVVPLTIMDGTLKDYLGLTPSEAIALITVMVEKVKAVNGTFVSLWHNDALSNQGDWNGWKRVYETQLKLCSEQ